jgi:hypothetical protein
MFEKFFDSENSTTASTCIECGKKIKSGHYYSGRGPYGICCYKKLFGTLGLIVTKYRTIFPKQKNKNNKEDMCDILGQNKNCNQCLFSENCEYKNESK